MTKYLEPHWQEFKAHLILGTESDPDNIELDRLNRMFWAGASAMWSEMVKTLRLPAAEREKRLLAIQGEFSEIDEILSNGVPRA